MFTALRMRYNQLLHLQHTSVKKQLSILTNCLPPEYKCMVVHTLKSHTSPQKPGDR